MKTTTLQFWTTGTNLTKLVRDFIREGSYDKAYQILESGGMPDKYIKDFFLMKLSFKGDTRKGDLLVTKISANDDIPEMLMTGMRTTFRENNLTFNDLNDIPDNGDTKKNIDRLFSVLGKDFVIRTITPLVFKQSGFKIITVPPVKSKNTYHSLNGAILADGTFVTCDFQMHKYLYPLLASLGYANGSDWLEDDLTIHITEGQMSGKVANNLRHDFKNERVISKEIIDTLFKFRSVLGEYGENESMMALLNRYVSNLENNGGKFNNLAYIKRFYKYVQLPLFSKEKIEGVKNQCIRTSPLYSLPGLLESKFKITKNSIKEIKETFAKYQNIIKGNELHYFYQEFIEGQNGVCNYIDNNFSYDLSDTQGDIVKGKHGRAKLSNELISKLRGIARELSTDLKQPVQLEFVVTISNQLYITQLRILRNNFENTHILNKPKKVLASGKTFSKGDVEVNINDILIVDRDAESKELLGKKALIVRDDVEFSHILALSKALFIPSMYGVGKIEMPEKGTVKFTAYNKESWITLS